MTYLKLCETGWLLSSQEKLERGHNQKNSQSLCWGQLVRSFVLWVV